MNHNTNAEECFDATPSLRDRVKESSPLPPHISDPEDIANGVISPHQMNQGRLPVQTWSLTADTCHTKSSHFFTNQL